ncbi:hypothetical protein Trydic_g16935 [Trypoxylus dichotomus]
MAVFGDTIMTLPLQKEYERVGYGRTTNRMPSYFANDLWIGSLRIGGKVIREDLEIQDKLPFSRAKRRFWKDPVDRMTEGRWVKWARNKIPNSRRPPGRPLKRWYESWTSTSQEIEE